MLIALQTAFIAWFLIHTITSRIMVSFELTIHDVCYNDASFYYLIQVHVAVTNFIMSKWICLQTLVVTHLIASPVAMLAACSTPSSVVAAPSKLRAAVPHWTSVSKACSTSLQARQFQYISSRTYKCPNRSLLNPCIREILHVSTCIQCITVVFYCVMCDES